MRSPLALLFPPKFGYVDLSVITKLRIETGELAVVKEDPPEAGVANLTGWPYGRWSTPVPLEIGLKIPAGTALQLQEY